MPYIVSTAIYPSERENEAREVFLEMMKTNPPRMDLSEVIIPMASQRSLEGIKIMAVSKVKPGKLEEALAYVSKRVHPYSKIPEFEYSIQIWSTLEEAFAVAGVPMPG